MKQLFEVSSLLQLVNVHAAITSGIVDDAEERILLVSDNRVINEVGPSFVDSTYAQPLLDVFDRIIDLNAWIRPYHPAQWSPREQDLPVWTRFVTEAWDIDGSDLQLFVESLQSHPALALARILSRAEVHVHSDGLMSYGPTRNVVEPRIRQRLASLLTMDLVPGLAPQLMREYEVPTTIVAKQALRDSLAFVEARLGAEELSEDPESTVIIGQYLSDVELFTVDEEVGIYLAMLDAAADRSSGPIFFKRHPAASASVGSILAHRADELGLDFQELPIDVPVEVCIARLRPHTVIGCFSTGLATANHLYGCTAIAIGTRQALQNFTPYQNSNRIPVTICDYLFSPEADWARTSVSLPDLVETVSYCMQAEQLPMLRETAIRFLSTIPDGRIPRYFRRRRLTKLDLPGRLPPSKRRPYDPRVLLGGAVRRSRRLLQGREGAPAKG